MEIRNCKYCRKIIEGNKKKEFCSDSCRVYSHRESKWININDKLTEEQINKLNALRNGK
jgi:hypothetical protein